MKTWMCKIGECIDTDLPPKSDEPMRAAVADAYFSLMGKDPDFIFSGWDAQLDEEERAIVEERLPDYQKTGFADKQRRLNIAERSGGCMLADTGRGDCQNAIGLPGVSMPGQHDGDDDTVDVYGKPNGWCWSCWKSRRIEDLERRNRNQKELIQQNPGAMLSIIRDLVKEPLECGHPLECWDEENEKCSMCVLIEERDEARRKICDRKDTCQFLKELDKFEEQSRKTSIVIKQSESDDS